MYFRVYERDLVRERKANRLKRRRFWAAGVNDMIAAIHTYSESTTNAKWLVALSSRVSNEVIIPDNANEVMITII